MEFAGKIFPPRPPTEKEMEELMVDFHETGLPKSDYLKVMGKDSANYNCLGWAIQRCFFIDDHKYFDGLRELIYLMDISGFEPTATPELADIDVWGSADMETGNCSVAHFALKTEYGWTSKLGYGMLVIHDRYDFASVTGMTDDGDESEYGRHIFHFKRKTGVSAPRPPIAEVCAMAKCDCATCSYYYCDKVEASKSDRKRSREEDD